MTTTKCTHESYITAYMYIVRNSNRPFWEREEKQSKPVAFWCTTCGAFQALDDANPGPVEWRLPSNATISNPTNKG